MLLVVQRMPLYVIPGVFQDRRRPLLGRVITVQGIPGVECSGAERWLRPTMPSAAGAAGQHKIRTANITPLARLATFAEKSDAGGLQNRVMAYIFTVDAQP